MGNLRSLEEALAAIGLRSRRVARPAETRSLDSLILPGVGGFPQAIAALDSSGMAHLLLDWVREERPLVGICLGMQLLFEGSDEVEPTKGLGLLPGWLSRLESGLTQGRRLRVPNVGWSEIKGTKGGQLSSLRKVMDAHSGLGGKLWMYFAHSFGVLMDSSTDSLATVTHGKNEYVAITRSGSISAFQGHPELSGQTGLELLRWALDQETA